MRPVDLDELARHVSAMTDDEYGRLLTSAPPFQPDEGWGSEALSAKTRLIEAGKWEQLQQALEGALAPRPQLLDVATDRLSDALTYRPRELAAVMVIYAAAIAAVGETILDRPTRDRLARPWLEAHGLTP
jgi:hypothetical protein